MPKKNPPLLLRECREKAGLTQEQLAALAGLTSRTIRRCERFGRWPLYLAQRRAVAHALGINPIALELTEETK